MNLALWFDVLVHVWNGDLWCCDDVNEMVDNKKKTTKNKIRVLFVTKWRCACGRVGGPFAGYFICHVASGTFFMENWRSTRHREGAR